MRGLIKAKNKIKMKKTLFIGIAVMATILSSCGSKKGTSIKTETDSLSYAIGTELGNMGFQFDSTMDVEYVVAGVREVFAKKPSMTREQANAFIQEYMTVGVARKNDQASKEFLAEKAKESGAVKSETGLVYKIDAPGAEPKVQMGDSVEVHYVLSLPNGQKLQSSKDRGQTYNFRVTEDGNIKGFTEGLLQLGEGGKTMLYIPYELGYGEAGNQMGGIGPKQALQFEVEVVKVVK